MIVIAGPSGSGKSSNFPLQEFGLPYFSVDDWCAQHEGSYQGISPETRRLGGQLCEAFVYDCINQRVSFAVETTLRGTHAIKQAQAAKLAGFSTHMIYISVDQLEIAVERVRLRGLAGGHSAPRKVIEEIYQQSHQNLAQAVKTFDVVQIYTSLTLDAQSEQINRLEAIFNQGVLSKKAQNHWPEWLRMLSLE
jgi:predicted ABC-type ATPase